jgi:hypothetical protein
VIALKDVSQRGSWARYREFSVKQVCSRRFYTVPENPRVGGSIPSLADPGRTTNFGE